MDDLPKDTVFRPPEPVRGHYGEPNDLQGCRAESAIDEGVAKLDAECRRDVKILVHVLDVDVRNLRRHRLAGRFRL